MKYANVAITIVVALAVISVGVVIVEGIDTGEWKENPEHFERYCTERFGEDAYVYSGGGQGVHGGLHCEDAEHKPVHLGAVEPEAWESYKNGTATSEDVTDSIRPVGVMGTVRGYPWKQFTVTAGLVLGVGLIARFRSE